MLCRASGGSALSDGGCGAVEPSRTTTGAILSNRLRTMNRFNQRAAMQCYQISRYMRQDSKLSPECNAPAWISSFGLQNLESSTATRPAGRI